jgi:hypothetical protein
VPGDLLVFLLIALVAAVIGGGFGMVVLAPRIGRLLDRQELDSDDEEPGDRPA